jgi:hypothetical protein
MPHAPTKSERMEEVRMSCGFTPHLRGLYYYYPFFNDTQNQSLTPRAGTHPGALGSPSATGRWNDADAWQ